MCIVFEITTNLSYIQHNKCRLKYEGSVHLIIEKNEFVISIKGTAYSEYVEIFTMDSGSILGIIYNKNEGLDEIIYSLNLPSKQCTTIFNKIYNSVQCSINTYVSKY